MLSCLDRYSFCGQETPLFSLKKRQRPRRQCKSDTGAAVFIRRRRATALRPFLANRSNIKEIHHAFRQVKFAGLFILQQIIQGIDGEEGRDGDETVIFAKIAWTRSFL